MESNQFCLACGQPVPGGGNGSTSKVCPACGGPLVPILDPETQEAVNLVRAMLPAEPDAPHKRKVANLVPLVERVAQGEAKSRRVLLKLADLADLAELAAQMSAQPKSKPANIQPALRGLALKSGASYPQPLPSELQPFYCYPLDCGHSILILPVAFRECEPVADYLVPAPVKTVLRLGWAMVRGVPVVDIEYDPQIGLVVPAADDEEW